MITLKHRICHLALLRGCLLFIALVFGCNVSKAQFTDEKQQLVDSLNRLIRNSTEDSVIVGAYGQLGELYHLFNTDTAAFMVRKADKIAIDALTTTHAKNERKFYLNFLARSFNNLGWYYMNKGKINRALAYNVSSLEIFETLKDTDGIANCYQTFGEVYLMQGDDENAMRHLRKALAYHREGGDKVGMASSMDLMAHIFMKSGQNDSALSRLLQAEILLSNEEAYLTKGEIYAHLGSVYLNLGDTSRSIIYNFKAYDLDLSSGSRAGRSIALCNLAAVDFSRKHYQSAREYAEESLEAAEEMGFPDRISEASWLLANIESRQGEYETALYSFKVYVQMQDSMRNATNEKLSMKHEQDYTYAREKDIQDKIYEKELAVASKHEEKQAIVTYFTLGALLLVILFSSFIFARYRLIRQQKKLIESQNSQIYSEITYSGEIQAALRPSENELKGLFSRYFIFNEPKDVVSGDFYLVKEVENSLIVACADCTGHGVPGGFMSTVGSLLLEKVIAEGELDPARILSRLNSEIIRVLDQQEGGAIQDGMDLAICVVDRKTGMLQMAGARNGITIIRQGKGERHKADLYPVGGNYMRKGKPIERRFNTQNIQLGKNDWVCMYSDGYNEQSGGDEGYPMTYAHFENCLVSAIVANKDQDIPKKLATLLYQWQGERERMDDLLVLGFQIG